MKPRTQINPGETVELNLTEIERQHILNDFCCLDRELEEIIRQTPADQPVRMTLDDLDQLSGHVAAEANHTKNKKLEKILDRVFDKITDLLDKYTDEPPPSIADHKKEKAVADQSKAISAWITQTLNVAAQMRIMTRQVEQFSLRDQERAALCTLSSLPKKLIGKLAKRDSTYTVAEIASLIQKIGEELSEMEPERHLRLLVISREMSDCLYDYVTASAKAKLRKSKKRPKSTNLYQFKVTLLGTTPPIWRRFQTFDGTLDELHYLIQAAMGWTNSHLHQFEIGGKRYGDPELLEDDFDDVPFIDSTVLYLSQLLPASKKRFAFKYEYDFGDGWEHEIVFEGCPEPEQGKKYPLCLEGERACPPGDVGGVWGYAEFLKAIADPNHEGHKELKRWAGKFDPEAFDPDKVTQRLA